MGLLDRFTSQKGKADKAAPKPVTKPAKSAVNKKDQAAAVKKDAFKAVPPAPEKKAAVESSANERKSTGDAHRILIGAVVTEKSTLLQKQNQYVFSVTAQASKKSVTEAVQKVYGVRPLAVNIVRLPGKWVRYGRAVGRQVIRKKAIVTLPAGKTIDTVSS
jgi:large subunit ribosomal protein L23